MDGRWRGQGWCGRLGHRRKDETDVLPESWVIYKKLKAVLIIKMATINHPCLICGDDFNCQAYHFCDNCMHPTRPELMDGFCGLGYGWWGIGIGVGFGLGWVIDYLNAESLEKSLEKN